MRQPTRHAYNALKAELCRIYGISDVSEQFAATPSIAQTIETHVQQSSAFLQLVNSITVDEKTGEKVGISISTTIAGRTDTTATDRATADVHDTDNHGYVCEQTNFDTHLRYATLDAWAKFQDFQTRVRDSILKQQGRDRLMIGWNGTSAAATTDRITNPLLQDVNIGWLAKLQTEKAAAYMTQGANAAKIQVGTAAGADYANLDELVYDMRRNLLAPWHANDTDGLVVLCSSDLVDDKFQPMVGANSGTPTEANALAILMSGKKIGGLHYIEVPYFPSRTIAITRLSDDGDSNLSIYNQEGTRRRHIADNPKRDRVENFESVNESYVIEDLGLMCAAINITYWNGTAWAG